MSGRTLESWVGHGVPTTAAGASWSLLGQQLGYSLLGQTVAVVACGTQPRGVQPRSRKEEAARSSRPAYASLTLCASPHAPGLLRLVWLHAEPKVLYSIEEQRLVRCGRFNCKAVMGLTSAATAGHRPLSSASRAYPRVAGDTPGASLCWLAALRTASSPQRHSLCNRALPHALGRQRCSSPSRWSTSSPAPSRWASG